MIKRSFTCKNFISERYLKKKLNVTLNKNYRVNFEKILKSFNHSQDTFHILSKNFKLNFKLPDLKRFKKFKSIVIIGMGGSILGTKAIFYLLKDKIKKDINFLDNLDESNIIKLKKKIKIEKTLFIVVSKSGSTTETLTNFFFLKIIKTEAKNIIIISEKKDNYLFSLAKKFKLFFIEHKSYIGGRYSVLSEVGVAPSFLMGLDINKLRLNLSRFLVSNDKSFLKESVLKLTNLLKQKRIKNLVFLNYVPELEKFLFWCQQLIAESLGKNGHGFLPIISNAPKDHHSLLQLYLDGPKDKLFQIFSLEKKSQTKIFTKISNKKINYINNKSLNEIKISQKNALVEAFKKKKIPYREFILKEKNEKTLGELFSYFILETAIIGKIAQINPFDQPAVEQVKKITKEILS